MMTRIAALACFAILVTKFLLISRININWDEFLYLAKVHDLLRGELSGPFQTAYTQAFRWLPATGDEIFQIGVARCLMTALLAVTAILIWKLASRWVDASAAWVAPFGYLSSMPVLLNGGAFRADSMLAPLTVAILVLLTRSNDHRRSAQLAGICFGIAMAITVKAVLLLPVLAVVMCVYVYRARSLSSSASRTTWIDVAWFFMVAAGLFSLLFLLHVAVIGQHVLSNTAGVASAAASKTLLHSPFLPHPEYWLQTWRADRFLWILLILGTISACLRRNFCAVACALSLLPILFYRNTFPYYYLVMLAPASVLAAFGFAMLADFVKKLPGLLGRIPSLLVAIIIFGMPTIFRLHDLTDDRQAGQRAVIAAVHGIFRQPVTYLDHSGMIASFRKSNFFMSTWGLETYRTRQASFMSKAIEQDRAVMLLANRSVLKVGTKAFVEGLLPVDQRLLKRFYVPYWGPISVAGASASLTAGKRTEVVLPFPGKYRLRSDGSIRIDGHDYGDGAVIVFDGRPLKAELIATADTITPQSISLVWAEARPAPVEAPPRGELYVGFSF